MEFEGMTQCEIRRSAVEFCAIVENAGFRDVVSVARKEGGVGVGSARATHTPRIGDDGGDSAKAVGWIADSAARRAGSEIGTKCIVILRNEGVASSDREAAAHTLLKGN